MAAIIFDLDGTLVHSAPDIHAGVNRMLAGRGMEPLDLATVTSFIGNGVPKLIERVIAARGLDPAGHGALQAEFLGHYNAAPTALTRPFDGVVDALEALRGRGARLGVCTNKPHGSSVAILKGLGLAEYFAAVVGGDSLPERKPDPAPLRAAFAGVGAATGIYVGDSEVDAACAAGAGVPFLLFTGGYRKTPVQDLPHARAFDGFAELPGLVDSLLAGEVA